MILSIFFSCVAVISCKDTKLHFLVLPVRHLKIFDQLYLSSSQRETIQFRIHQQQPSTLSPKHGFESSMIISISICHKQYQLMDNTVLFIPRMDPLSPNINSKYYCIRMSWSKIYETLVLRLQPLPNISRLGGRHVTLSPPGVSSPF